MRRAANRREYVQVIHQHETPNPMCTGKRSFRDKHTAEKQAKHMRRNIDSSRATEYRCGLCHFWHIG